MSLQRFNDYISRKTFEGYKIVDKNESSLTAVLEKSGIEKLESAGEKTFTIKDIILTIITSGIWLIFWIIKKPSSSSSLTPITSRIRVSFDSSGNLIEEKG